jgi:hypothetical protein
VTPMGDPAVTAVITMLLMVASFILGWVVGHD